jgi:hypothetical protein
VGVKWCAAVGAVSTACAAADARQIAAFGPCDAVGAVSTACAGAEARQIAAFVPVAEASGGGP